MLIPSTRIDSDALVSPFVYLILVILQPDKRSRSSNVLLIATFLPPQFLPFLYSKQPKSSISSTRTITKSLLMNAHMWSTNSHVVIVRLHTSVKLPDAEKIRIREHHRSDSAISSHLLSHDTASRCTSQDFSILAHNSFPSRLRILEAFFIRRLRPSINRKDDFRNEALQLFSDVWQFALFLPIGRLWRFLWCHARTMNCIHCPRHLDLKPVGHFYFASRWA